ncbi:MAG: ECF transporter S component [Clostridia bacterium]|nr:ECF transporter S component [Clostridia bacterium]
MKSTSPIKKIALSGMFLALALVLPFFTGQIPQIGAMLAPMHIPVLLCGFLCGPIWGAVVGIVAPLLRHLLFSMPPLMTAIPMAFELAAYGALSGIFDRIMPKGTLFLYLKLILAMLGGRAVWGIAAAVVYGAAGNPFGLQAFIAGAFINALPGIALHIILIPLIVMAVKKYRQN